MSSIWHPFTQHKIFPTAFHIDSAQGVYLHARDGRKIIDGISSWWVNIHGHCHPKIQDAIAQQAKKLDQVIFAGFSHDPAEKLAEKLINITGEKLQKVFYSDSGSTAIEVALKMAIGAWHNKGETRTKIIALEDSYHGDTFATMAAGARSVFNAAYDPFMFDVEHIKLSNAHEELKILLKREHQKIAAFICEPLVQGAGGMNMYSKELLKSLYDQCQLYNIPFIADEVMTGFGRTGAKFACEIAGFTPDILCLSKALTNGFLPLAVTLTTQDMFDAFYSDDRSKTFFHSSSFSGNPLACAAANATLELWEEEPVVQRIASLTQKQAAFKNMLSEREDIKNLRQTGTIVAFELDIENEGYLSDVGPESYKFFIENEILLRPLGNTVYILPPYCIQDHELERIYTTILKSLDHLKTSAHRKAS